MLSKIGLALSALGLLGIIVAGIYGVIIYWDTLTIDIISGLLLLSSTLLFVGFILVNIASTNEEEEEEE